MVGKYEHTAKRQRYSIRQSIMSDAENFEDEDRLHGPENIRLSDKTHAMLREKFAEEVGMAVKRLGVLSISRRARIPVGQQYLFMGLNTLPSIIRTATMNQCLWYIQRGDTCLMCFRFSDGNRMLCVRTDPVALQIRVVESSTRGVGILIGTQRRTEAVEFSLNICVVDRYTCFACGKTAVRMKCCEKCKEKYTCTRYCSFACQKTDWRYHAAVCGK